MRWERDRFPYVRMFYVYCIMYIYITITMSYWIVHVYLSMWFIAVPCHQLYHRNPTIAWCICLFIWVAEPPFRTSPNHPHLGWKNWPIPNVVNPIISHPSLTPFYHRSKIANLKKTSTDLGGGLRLKIENIPKEGACGVSLSLCVSSFIRNHTVHFYGCVRQWVYLNLISSNGKKNIVNIVHICKL